MGVIQLLLTKRENMDIEFHIKGYSFSTMHYTNNELLDKWDELGIADSDVHQIEIKDLYTLEVYSF